jgi:hypothetical protein
MRASAHGNARNYQAGRDQNFIGEHHHQYDVDVDVDLDPTGSKALFEGRGPGRILLVVGLVVALASFAGWMSIIFGASTESGADGAQDFLGQQLPSGVRVGVAYFLGFGAGGVVSSIGAAMATAGARRGVTVGHWVVTVVLLSALVLGVLVVLGGAPLSALTPHFQS